MRSPKQEDAISLSVVCPFCRKRFPKQSDMIFTSLEQIKIQLPDHCERCKFKINQWFWGEKGADGNIRICAGNLDDVRHPIATISGVIASNGIINKDNLKKFAKLGLKINVSDR